MKKLLLPIIVLIAGFTTVKAQTDYCKDITKSAKGNQIFYDSPTPADKNQDFDMFGFTKIVEIGHNQLYFKLGIAVTHDPGPRTDVTFTFEDGDVLTVTDLPVSKDKDIPFAPTIVHPLPEYLYYTLIPLTTDQLAKFKTKKIKSYVIFGLKRVPGFGNPKVKIMAYANCIEALASVTAGVDASSFITKDFDEMKGVTIYSSPISESIQMLKSIDRSGQASVLTFYVSKAAPGDAQQTVYIKFDDGKILNFPAATTYNKQGRGDYLYANMVTLTADNIKDFKEKKIVKFQVADVDVLVGDALGAAVTAWTNNLDNLK